MFRERAKGWLTGTGHLSDDELLLHLDGELSGRKATHASKHIHACWQCRTKSEKIAQTIVRFVDCRNALAEEDRPPNNWAGFDSRLRALTVQSQPGVSKWRRIIPQLYPGRLAVAAAGILLALLWIHNGSEQPLSAAEILRRAEWAEVDASRGKPQPVVYQRLQVRRRSGRKVVGATLESWSDVNQRRQKQTGDQELWNRLQTILRQNHLGDGRILSAADYDAWRARLHDKHEVVQSRRLEDGSEALSINTVTGNASAPDTILEAALVVRTRDWHPVEQNLRVQGKEEVSEFEVSEVSYEVTARNSLPDSIFDRERRPVVRRSPALPRPSPQALRPPDPPPPDLDESEILALTAFHRTAACLGEPLEIVREDRALVVRGLADTAQRKEGLAAALQDIPFLRFEVQTVEEALRTTSQATSTPDAGVAPQLEQVHSGPPPIAGRLKQRLTPQEATALANRVVSLSDAVLAHAWALRRLEQAWPAERISHLGVAARALLEGLVRDHTRELRENLTQCRSALGPLLPQAGSLPPGDAADAGSLSLEAPALLEGAQAAQRLTRSLFTGSDMAADAIDDALSRLASSLADAESRSRRLEAGLTQFSHTSRETGSLEEKGRP